MFVYNGKSEQFRKTAETYGTRLAAIYEGILKGQMPSVRSLNTHGLMYTPPRGQVTLSSIEHQMGELLQNDKSHTSSFLMASIDLTSLNEALTRELDRRVLRNLGYHNTESWLLSGDKYGDDMTFLMERDKRRERVFSTLPTNNLVEYIKMWHGHILPGNVTYNLVQTCCNYEIQKVAIDEIGGVEDFLKNQEAPSCAMSQDLDNMQVSMILDPPRDNIKIDNEGNMTLVGTSKILTSSYIVLSDDGVDLIRDKLTKGIPPYLVAMVHEFDHFIGYCIQDYPMGVATGLLHLKATEK